MLALAHKIQDAIDRGAVRDRAEVAQRLGLTRARVTQLLDLTLLAPDIQESILFVQSVDGIEPVTERELRPLCDQAAWSVQRRSFLTSQGKSIASIEDRTPKRSPTQRCKPVPSRTT